MTDEGIALEYETYLAAQGKTLKECYKCSCHTHQTHCPVCGIELTGDATIDEVFERIERGEDIDLNAALRGESWEPVP